MRTAATDCADMTEFIDPTVRSLTCIILLSTVGDCLEPDLSGVCGVTGVICLVDVVEMIGVTVVTGVICLGTVEEIGEGTGVEGVCEVTGVMEGAVGVSDDRDHRCLPRLLTGLPRLVLPDFSCTHAHKQTYR